MEAIGCLVAPPVVTIGGRRLTSSAGSIPDRLLLLPLRWRSWKGGMASSGAGISGRSVPMEFDVRGRRKVVLGVVHLRPLPGTPFYAPESFKQTLDAAIGSARALDQGGADGCLIQTVDRVYSVDDESDPARVAAMSLITRAIVEATGERFHVGVHMLRNAVRASLAVAKVTGGTFVRVGALVGRTMTPQGMVEATPLRTAEYRKSIDADLIRVIADIHSMHFKWPGDDKPVEEVALAAKNAGADAVALCDRDEGRLLEVIASVRKVAPLVPIILAGYTTHENAPRLLRAADGAFVGSCLEPEGWGGEIDIDRVRAFMQIVRSPDSIR
jgi:uncharacterized protein